ncbi:mannuronan 5-epimerase AlgG [Pseudomonas sp. DTU_2021_1001937_2_SI_NGA_ILE_001]|uniref:mannuronan 5-epimerase AlgG n=1 Tax=Pseudomonas sp. DTU_2021_1001937_2_SI_NGA_ILE_001 TaxID=3077589 RepID=UPI0028FC2089|nr:mannuronan 5-epimerase AlgG [Pseudomonas sp. DTU_2021_1001937_2_SI_NGA_ILE_001]WNW13544.1 mannuronan 5-epimerase AlgG [Pseudomonas sp. DTU_2021_1001937_2_SI_NGA_ILE_001]
MNRQINNPRGRTWPHTLLESAVFGGALLMASVALANTPAVSEAAKIVVKDLQETNSYNITSPAVEPLAMEKPKLPDLSGYTLEAALKKIDRSKPGKVRVSRMMEETGLKEFIGGDNKMAEWVARQRGIPDAIIIQDGYVSLQDVARQVPKQFLSEVSPGVYVARLPILVKDSGILEIDKRTRELRLSQEKGSFLVSEGKLLITQSQLNGWSESRNGPATFRKPSEFRPFLLTWGGSETWIANTKMASLGYDQSKSYGVSISQYTPNTAKVLNRPEPTGWIIDSEFSDLWYGFYCYETRDFVIKGNTYRDNIVYGIDPHDRSHGLIIAENTVHGTKKKHGIIISREVDRSFIFRNKSYDNKLSGVVLDRNSVGNIVAYNDIYQNHTDGITLYESGDNLLWGNRVVANRRHGIRVRNSTNIKLYENFAMANGLMGIYGHIKDLTDTDRDIELDPFDAEVSLIVVGGELAGNKSGPLSIDSPLSVELYDVSMLAPTKSSGISFNGVLGEHQSQILDLLVRQKKAVLIDPVESQSELRQ